jgi:hypothetical protein
VSSKETVRRLIEQAITGGHDELVDELFTAKMAGAARPVRGIDRPCRETG